MSSTHYRDTCSRCIELEKQVNKLLQKQAVRSQNRFCAYQLKRERLRLYEVLDLYVFWFCLCILGGFVARSVLDTYPTWLVLASCVLVVIRTKFAIVKTHAYVGNTAPLDCNQKTPEAIVSVIFHRKAIDTDPKS